MIYRFHLVNRKRLRSSYLVYCPMESILTFKFCSARLQFLSQKQLNKSPFNNLQVHKKSLKSNKTIFCPNFYSLSNRLKKKKKKLRIRAIRISQTQLSCRYKTKKNQNKLEKDRKMRTISSLNFMKELKNLTKNLWRFKKHLFFCESSKRKEVSPPYIMISVLFKGF